MADPLDVAALTARLHSTAGREHRSLAMLERDMPGWVAWSGGKDSTAVAVLANDIVPGIPLVHYDSGLDFPETTAYMESLADARGWNYQPVRVGDALAEMVRNGSWDFRAADEDSDFWWVICEGPAQHAHQTWGDALAWGLRADESHGRRMQLMSSRGVRHRRDGTTTVAPIWWWTRRDVFACLHRRGIPRNPLYDRLAELGVPERDQRVSLAVGSDGSHSGRLVWLRRGWPDLWARYQRVLPRMKHMS